MAPRLTFDPSSNVLSAAEQAAVAEGSPLHVPPITAVLNGPADILVRRFESLGVLVLPHLPCCRQRRLVQAPSAGMLSVLC